MTEAELKREVVRMAHELGWKVFSLPMIRNVRPVKDAVGYPDLTLARDGTVLWIELKTDAGVLSADQIAWMDALHPNMHVIRPNDLGGDRLYGMLR